MVVETRLGDYHCQNIITDLLNEKELLTQKKNVQGYNYNYTCQIALLLLGKHGHSRNVRLLQ